MAGSLAAQCSYTVNPVSTTNISADAASGSIAVSTGNTCAWTAAVDTKISWLKLDVQSGTGPGLVHWTADANLTPVSRNGAIQVAGQLITIQQAAANCAFNL